MANPRLVHVETVEQLTPRLIRIVFGGDGLAGFAAGEFTDHYVKLQVPPQGADYAAPFDVEEIRADAAARAVAAHAHLHGRAPGTRARRG